MTFRKSTRYALYAAMEMARASDETPVTAGHVAARYGIPGSVLAKVFQQLVRAGLAVGTRGIRGGYRLTRTAAEVTVLDVIEAFEPARPPEQCLLADHREPTCSQHEVCRLRRLFDEVDETTRCTYASVSLGTLVGRQPLLAGALRVIH
jgi:Rrf2 family protein